MYIYGFIIFSGEVKLWWIKRFGKYLAVEFLWNDPEQKK